MSNFHALTVSEVKKETPNSVCISFNVPEELSETFRFIPGQYITIKHNFKDAEIRRAYSICSSPNSGILSVGVKKVKNGAFSVYANETLKAGDSLEVMPPEGKFTLEVKKGNANHYLAFAAGSGITPVLSIMTSVLEGEPSSTFTLIFGNQSLQETMFSEDIERLLNDYPDRLTVEYLFSRRKEDFGLFGRIDRSTVNYILKNRLARIDYHSYYLCGPEQMIQTVTGLLKEKGVSEDQIHFELFTSSSDTASEIVTEGQTQITVVLDDETESFVMDRDTPILNACLDHGLDAPYSCQGGICSTCIARIKEGKAEMRKNQILTDDEIEEGLILTCQAHPVSANVTIDYDDV